MTELRVVVGLGGVGKTTTSAAFALRLAEEGARVVVLTIDPARRLADALGIARDGAEPVLVPHAGQGRLHAQMLDRKATWDAVIRRYAPSPEIRDRLLANHYYASVSTRLGGSQEYMANEKLYELVESGRWDVVVVDTPPARQAAEFFAAPERMRQVFDQRVLEGFLRPGAGLMARAGRKVTAVLSGLAGERVLSDIAEFFALTAGLSAGFRARHRAVHQWLHDPAQTQYFFTVSARGSNPRDVADFVEVLTARNLGLSGFFVNRTSTDLGAPEPAIPAPPEGVNEITWRHEVLALQGRAHAMREAQRTEDSLALALVQQRAPIWKIPELSPDLFGLDALQEIARHLPPTAPFSP